MIIQRYILRLIAVPFVFISLLITVLLLAEAFGEVVTRALGGTLPGTAVVQLIAFQVPDVLLELMPGAFFLSAVMALGQMSASSERVVLQAVGYSDQRIQNLVLVVAVLVTALTLAFSLWLSPMAARSSAALEQTLAERPAAELVVPGQFTALGDDGSTLYARGNNAQGDLTQVFLALVEDDQQQLITAELARVVMLEGTRYLRLTAGELLVDSFGDELEKSVFDTMFLRLDIPTVSFSAGRSAQTLEALWNSNTRRDQIEAQQRILYPLNILVFAFWAVTLTRYTPRSGKNAAILPAIIFYVLFMYVTRTVNAGVRSDVSIPIWATYWWVQIAAIMLALLLRWPGLGKLTEAVKRRLPSWRSAS